MVEVTGRPRWATETKKTETDTKSMSHGCLVTGSKNFRVYEIIPLPLRSHCYQNREGETCFFSALKALKITWGRSSADHRSLQPSSARRTVVRERNVHRMELIYSKNHPRCELASHIRITFSTIPPLTTQLCKVGVNFFPLETRELMPHLPQLPLSKALFRG